MARVESGAAGGARDGVAAPAQTPSITPDAPPVTGLNHRQIMIVFSGLMLGMLLAALDQTIVSTALPTIVGELHGLNHLSWVVTAYLLTSTASTPLYGKISDLYGRKRVFQAAIVIFLVASALAGLSQTMNQLIVTRALQGVGGGGLMTLAMAIIGDIVSPRQRGRYQGYFGAVFAVASVGGPLLGGFFVDHLTWRWVFYINLPLGIVALVVTSTVLNLSFPRRPHRIDYLGSALMVGAVCAFLLVTVWGGTTYSWGSPQVLGALAAGAALLAAFVAHEQRAAEPILPLRLFRNPVFTVSNVISFVTGLAMFGAIVFLPLYMQLVKGASATASGLLMLPLMAGMLAASIVSGRLIVRMGRYKIFPVVGSALAAVGMWLLSYLGADTARLVFSAFMVVLGVGIGMTMQVLVLATQNAVEHQDLGVATSAVNFFRSMGGSFGTAIFGAILVNRLAYNLARILPAGVAAKVPAGSITGSPAAIRHLTPVIRHGFVQAFVDSLHVVFVVATPIMAIAFLLALTLRDIRLRDTVNVGQAAATAMPKGAQVAEGVAESDLASEESEAADDRPSSLTA
ncbi:MAG TPA: MDR family MFS transporter [Acidimicrobiales bacterium]|nr:MDR family MFS transporter [Acidimicrobiales bacterium]